jgi:hypothetical protein
LQIQPLLLQVSASTTNTRSNSSSVFTIGEQQQVMVVGVVMSDAFLSRGLIIFE